MAVVLCVMLLRIARSVWVWGATALLAIPEFFVMLCIRAVDRDPMRRKTARFMHGCGALITRFLPRWRVSHEGCDVRTLSGPFVVVANHQSHTDIPVICTLPLEVKWVAKKELFSIPVAGWMFSLAGEIAVDRKNSRAGAKALIQTGKYLDNGISVVFFPEGTRSSDGKLLRFQDGPFRIALKKGIPVLPVVVEGTGKLLPRNSLLFSDHNLFRVRLLPPVDTGAGQWKDAISLRDEVRTRMQAALDAMVAKPPDPSPARQSSEAVLSA